MLTPTEKRGTYIFSDLPEERPYQRERYVRERILFARKANLREEFFERRAY